MQLAYKEKVNCQLSKGAASRSFRRTQSFWYRKHGPLCDVKLNHDGHGRLDRWRPSNQISGSRSNLGCVKSPYPVFCFQEATLKLRVPQPAHLRVVFSCLRMLWDSVIPLPHIYGARIKGVEVFCPLDPPPPYETVAGSSTGAVAQVHPTVTAGFYLQSCMYSMYCMYWSRYYTVFFPQRQNGFYCSLPSSTKQLADIWNMFSCRCHRSLVVETVVDVSPPASASAFLQRLLLGRQIADLYIYIKKKSFCHYNSFFIVQDKNS